MTTFECPHGCIDCNTCRTGASARRLAAAEGERDRLKETAHTWDDTFRELRGANKAAEGLLSIERARADAAEARAAELERAHHAASKFYATVDTAEAASLRRQRAELDKELDAKHAKLVDVADKLFAARRSLEEARRLLADYPTLLLRLATRAANDGGSDQDTIDSRLALAKRICAFLATPSPDAKR